MSRRSLPAGLLGHLLAIPAATAEEMSSQADNLQRIMSFFKVDHGSTASLSIAQALKSVAPQGDFLRGAVDAPKSPKKSPPHPAEANFARF